MLVDDCIARIAAVPALASRCEGAAQFASLVAADALPNETPFAFVLPIALDASDPIDATGLHVQVLRETIGVVLICDYAGDATGAMALPEISDLRDAAIAALAGWTPPGAIDALALRRARLIDIKQGTIFYQLDFSLQSQLRIP